MPVLKLYLISASVVPRDVRRCVCGAQQMLEDFGEPAAADAAIKPLLAALNQAEMERSTTQQISPSTLVNVT